jgi:two-component system OmpR family sensor kinase
MLTSSARSFAPGRGDFQDNTDAGRVVLASVCSAYETRARAEGVRIDVDASPDTANVDPARFRQAVENLLDNSLRHTPMGGTIRLKAGRRRQLLLLEVEDIGPGVPEHLLDRAFEPFARSETNNGDGAGVGLGLAIVRAVAEAHGGSARAENLPGGGARLSLTLRA